jgi:isoleucyl-tRNA synthetase
VGDVVRNFTLTLWNTYSFFVTYANLDGWKPGGNEPIEYSPLDRWLRSTLNTLVRDVTSAMENYDVTGATRPIETFVNYLSTWFLRRSRRRFWKTESDADKRAAYATLYEALVTLSKLLAPSMPFLAEELYQNLVRSWFSSDPSSVHLADWPECDGSLINEGLNREMATVMKLASLGHAARNKANRKVRQPLAEAAFAVGNLDEQDAVEHNSDLLADELNVKRVRILDVIGEAVAYSVNPLPKQLGQKYGRLFPGISKAISDLPAEAAAKKLLGGDSLQLMIEGKMLDILPEEVEVRMQAQAGYAVASEGAYLAALVTSLTPELVREGLAREFVRRVQDLRKLADLDIADRITLFYSVTPGLRQAVMAYQEYIKVETLTIEMEEQSIPPGVANSSDQFDGEQLSIGLVKASISKN